MSNIPEIIIDNIEDLKEFISFINAINFKSQEIGLLNVADNQIINSGYIFRGQRDPSWKLTSTLEREISENIPKLNSNFYNDICKDLLERYKPLFRGRISEQYLLLDEKFNDELWAFGQHYDLKTPLLDWSYSFFVALYFAFAKQDSKVSHRAVFIINRYAIPFAHNIQYIEPKLDIGGRLNAQKGLFTKNISDDFEKLNQNYQEAMNNLNNQINSYSKLLNGFDFEKYSFFGTIPSDKNLSKFAEIDNFPLNKILISNNLRTNVLNLLKSVNVDGFTLFPDTKGLVEQCHLELENMIFGLKMEGY